MKKRVFNLRVNNKSVRTMKEMRENFFIEDIYKQYKEGTLQNWLDCRGYYEEYERVAAISEIIKRLMEIFGVEGIGNTKEVVERYCELKDKLVDNDGDVKVTKKVISELVEQYLPIMEMDFIHLIQELHYKDATLTILCLLMNEKTRGFFKLYTPLVRGW